MIDISKWTVETMWNTVLDKQNLGLKYHHEMIEIFTLIDMSGYAEWQKHQMRSEGEKALKMEELYINKFKHIYNFTNFSKDTLIKNNFLSNNTYSIDNKRAIIDEIFNFWCEWEKSVIELYIGCVQWCILNQCSDYIYFNKMLKKVLKEKEEIDEHFQKLKDIKYNINNIIDWQEHIYNKYKE